MKWTSVTTRIPKKPGPYLVTSGRGIWVEAIHPSWWNYRDRRGKEFYGPEVTHWMRLPPLPRLRT